MSATSECKPWRELAGDMANWFIPPRITVLMSGVSYAKQDSRGNITLTYIDGKEESAACPDIELKDEENFFKIVGTVQDRARSGS